MCVRSDRIDRRVAEWASDGEKPTVVGEVGSRRRGARPKTAVGEAPVATARLQCSVCALSTAGVGPVERHERVVVRQVALE